MDLGCWVRDRRYRPLLQLIDQLPEASRLRGAMLDDPDQAEVLADRRELADPGPAWRPKIHQWDLHAVLLTELRESIIALYQLQRQAATGKRGPSIPPFPTPETEVDRALARRDRTAVEDFLTRLLPHQYTP